VAAEPPPAAGTAPRSLRRRTLAAVLLAGLLATGACGGEAPAATGTTRAIDITIDDRTVTPAPGRIELARGTTVRLTVTSDVGDTVHIHGYDREFIVRPGVAGSVEFVAKDSGLYEVETHGQKLQLVQLVVR
jgi:hypothetical protein